MQRLALLVVAFSEKRGIRTSPVFSAYAVVIGIINLTIFHRRIFPDCYPPDAGGLTPFKQTSETVICLNLLVAGRLLIQRRTGLDARSKRSMDDCMP
jgi:hypothetical protein